MVQHRTMLNVADNSGANKLMVIGLPGAGKKRFARLGDIVTCVVKEADPNGQIRESEIVRALIIRTKKEKKRPDGSYVRFSDNAAVIIDQQKNLRGTRIFGPVAGEIKDKGFNKIISLAPEVL